MPSTRSEYESKLDEDFPDGFLATFETEPRENRIALHVFDTRSDGNMILLVTAEDIPGKAYEFSVENYEVIQDNPRLVRITTKQYPIPFLFSDNMSDQLREQMRNARRGDTHIPDEDDPPVRPGNKSPSETVTVTAEDRQDPEVDVRAKIVELLEGNP